MQITKIYLGMLAAYLLVTGCTKEALIPYSSGAGISIYKAGISEGRDSLVRSFAIMPATVQFDTIEIPLRIIGEVASQDRSVNYDVIPNLTTAAPANYELLPAVILAGSHTGTLQIKVNKTPDLETKDVRIWIRLLPSEAFSVVPKELSQYMVRVNDFLTKPVSWNDVRFGEYSQVKYGLIIRETGYHDFTALHPEVLFYIVGKCRNVLNAYLDAHGTEMLDENQLPVRFP